MSELQNPNAMFSDFSLNTPIHRALEDAGYKQPTPIQESTIPSILEGRDVLGLAQTGSGKTAAFGLPILSNIDLSQTLPQAIILAPTRELAIQVSDAIHSYGKYLNDLRIAPICGGQRYDTQIKYLKKKAHIVVGTPGRVMDLIEKGILILSNIKYVVLDEADEMLNMGFLDDVEWILKQTPKERQTVLFSATMPAPIQKITQKHLNNPLNVSIKSKTKTASTITQKYIQTANANKSSALLQILSNEPFDAVIIFGRTKAITEQLADLLVSSGFQCKALNGDMPQIKREKTIKQFRAGIFNIIVATDVAARGLDVDSITHVINYDIPQSSLSYIHRIGRTGRAGRKGLAITIVSQKEMYALRRLEKATKQQIERYKLPSKEEQAKQQFNKIAQRLTEKLKSGKQETARDLIKTYCQENDVSELDVCAALLAMQTQTTHANLPAIDISNEFEDRGGRKRDRRDEKPKKYGQSKKDNKDKKGKKSKIANLKFKRYKISLGQADNIKPGNIVGAIANEASLARNLIGDIKIYEDHSTVELPNNLPNKVLQTLSKSWFGGKQLNLVSG